MNKKLKLFCKTTLIYCLSIICFKIFEYVSMYLGFICKSGTGLSKLKKALDSRMHRPAVVTGQLGFSIGNPSPDAATLMFQIHKIIKLKAFSVRNGSLLLKKKENKSSGLFTRITLLETGSHL